MTNANAKQANCNAAKHIFDTHGKFKHALKILLCPAQKCSADSAALVPLVGLPKQATPRQLAMPKVVQAMLGLVRLAGAAVPKKTAPKVVWAAVEVVKAVPLGAAQMVEQAGPHEAALKVGQARPHEAELKVE